MNRASGMRPLVLSVHRWTGLAIGLLILFSAISGMGLAFRIQAEPAVYSKLMTSSRCAQQTPLDQIVANAQAAYPASPAQYVRVYGDPAAPARVRFGGNDTLYVDRCTGKVLGDMNRYHGLFGRIEQFHTMRYWKNGSAFVASWALAFAALLILGGIYIVWPMLRNRPRQTLTLNRRLKRRAWNLNMHRALALYACPLFLLTAFTALPQGFEWVENGLKSLDTTPTAPPPLSTPSTGKRISLEQAYQSADRIWPQAQEMLIQIPRNPNEPYEIFAIAREAWHANARSYLYLDAWSGKTLSLRPYGQLGIGSKIYFTAISLHTGMPFGVPGQLALFLSALALTFVIYGGYASFLRSKLPKRNATPLA